VIANYPVTELHKGKLADIAPTILKIMDIEIPKEMTGKVLF
jgi:2,3-bisphosphoglycerate-independent phosphoglycerate mutase